MNRVQEISMLGFSTGTLLIDVRIVSIVEKLTYLKKYVVGYLG